jgi:hypothetical protein
MVAVWLALQALISRYCAWNPSQTGSTWMLLEIIFMINLLAMFVDSLISGWKQHSLKEAHNLIKNSVLCDFLLAAKDLWNSCFKVLWERTHWNFLQVVWSAEICNVKVLDFGFDLSILDCTKNKVLLHEIFCEWFLRLTCRWICWRHTSE